MDDEPTTTPAPADWKAQRDAARRDAIRYIREAAREIAAAEARIDRQLAVLRDLELTYQDIFEATGYTSAVVAARVKRAQETDVG